MPEELKIDVSHEGRKVTKVVAIGNSYLIYIDNKASGAVYKDKGQWTNLLAPLPEELFEKITQYLDERISD